MNLVNRRALSRSIMFTGFAVLPLMIPTCCDVALSCGPKARPAMSGIWITLKYPSPTMWCIHGQAQTKPGWNPRRLPHLPRLPCGDSRLPSQVRNAFLPVRVTDFVVRVIRL